MHVNNTTRERGSQQRKTPLSKSLVDLRAIGKRAHKQGGRKKMIATFWRLHERGIHVGYAWDGIGGWYK